MKLKGYILIDILVKMYRKSSVKLHSSIKQCCITAPFHTKYAVLLYKEQ